MKLKVLLMAVASSADVIHSIRWHNERDPASSRDGLKLTNLVNVSDGNLCQERFRWL